MASRAPEPPRWFTENRWLALEPGPFVWENSRSGKVEPHRLEVLSAGKLPVPSGELIATSLILGLSVEEEDNGGYLRVPPGTYDVRLTLDHGCESRERPSAGYLSLSRGSERETERRVLSRVGGGDQDGIFDVSKYVFAVCDRGRFRAAFGGSWQRVRAVVGRWQRFQTWLEECRIVHDPVVQRFPLPGGGDVLAVELLLPRAAAVGGFGADGSLVALHFSFLTHAVPYGTEFE